MIFVQVLENNKVGLIHYQPFDSEKGLRKTEEELLQAGILVEALPEPEQIIGKSAALRYDGTNLYYEYVDVPLTQEEQTKQEIETLKAQNAQMLFALVQGGLI